MPIVSRAYQRNINTHSSYEDFRLARAKLRDLGEPSDSMMGMFMKHPADSRWRHKDQPTCVSHGFLNPITIPQDKDTFCHH